MNNEKKKDRDDRIEELEHNLNYVNETIYELKDKVSESQKQLITLKSYGKSLQNFYKMISSLLINLIIL